MRKYTFQILLGVTTVVLLCGSSSIHRKNTPTPYYLNYDSLSLPSPNIPEDNPMTVEGVRLGRYLFYDPVLSGDNTYSCSSCHKQENAFTDGRALAIGYKGEILNRNSMSLVNLAWENDFFWDGRVHSLEELVRQPITDDKEMGQDTVLLVKELERNPKYKEMFNAAFGDSRPTMDLVSKALSQFLRTIVSKGIHLPDSVLAMPPENMKEKDYVESKLQEKSMRGLYFRFATMCGSCHISAVYSGYTLANNGVPAPKKQHKIPTLLNITETAPYMHDGRFKSLDEVLNHYDNHIAGLNIYDKDGNRVKNLILDYDKVNFKKFMSLFRDENLLTNKDYSNPFH